MADQAARLVLRRHGRLVMLRRKVHTVEDQSLRRRGTAGLIQAKQSEGRTSMKNAANKLNRRTERRSFLKNVAAGGATASIGLLANGLPAFGQSSGGVTKGDVAILTFLAAIELIESDLWLQYAELG